MRFLLAALVLLALGAEVLGGRLPLKESRRRQGEARRRKMGCEFGDSFHELMSEWHPDLGPPSGVLSCIQCKCLPFHKKRRVVGRVSCKNVANLCPEPNCPEPVLAPGACCKLCPNQTFQPNVFGERHERGDYSWDPGYQEYMALLTGRFQFPPVLTEGVGRAYLTLYHQNLHYSIVYERLEESPVAIQILDSDYSILYERFIEGRHHPKKLCGVWSDVPRVYARALKRGRLSVVLVTAKQPDGAIGGAVLKGKNLYKEAFSSILAPTTLGGARSLGYGGVAVIDVKSGGNVVQIHIKLNASHNVYKDSRSSAYIFLEKHDGRRKQLKSYRTQLQIEDELYTLDATLRLGTVEQRWLSRGKLLLSVRFESLIPDEFFGLITPKQSCDVYQAALRPENPNGPVGYALVDLTEDSSFKYTIRVSGVNDREVVGFSIDRELKKRQRRKQVAASTELTEFVRGQSKGYLTKQISIKDIELLTNEKLNFAVHTSSDLTLRGKLKRILYSDSVQPDQSFPSVLSGPSSLGLAWFGRPESRNDRKNTVEPECALAFTLNVAGLTDGKPRDLVLSLCDGEISNCAHNTTAGDFKIVHGGIDDLAVYGIMESLPSETWRLLAQGQASLRVGSMSGPVPVVPNHCYRRGFQRDLLVAEDSYSNSAVRSECMYDHVTYSDGQSWHATHEKCSMCSCQHGRVRCDRVVCPEPQCSNPVKIDGDCCLSCASIAPQTLQSDPGCLWDGDQRWHAPGTTWHPYIPPFGFSKCALCTCQPHTQQVTCIRTACPVLDCAPELRYRANVTDCCRKCRPAPTTVAPPTPHALMADAPIGQCQFNHKRYNDGQKFVPGAHVAQLKCVVCHCQMGHVTCRRARCTADLPCDAPERSSGCCDSCRPAVPAWRRL